MCGIAGVWNLGPSGLEPEDRVKAMLQAMAHRGPDGTGTLAWPGGAAGMVRLALVDLSTRGQQPLWSPDGKVAIVFNGEMYNHAEHRDRLKSGGYPFKSLTDTEVALALYLERGVAFVEALRGMFALAIFDFRERGLQHAPKLVLARDPFGIKPLYLARVGNTLCFSSELRSLMRCGLLPKRIDREGLTDFLMFGFVLQPRTIFESVTMLERGTVHVEEPARPPAEHRYWLMPPTSDGIGTFPEACQSLRAVLEDSVKVHALADAPVGAFLSAGVDSSVTVALMAKHNPKLRTYTLKLTDSKYDESPRARDFAARLGCEHTEVEVGDAEVSDLFTRFGRSLDQPSTDGFNTWLISRAAARHVKGVLSGLGGDEWFGGYPVIQRMKALSPAHRLAGTLAQRTKTLLPRRLDELSRRAQARVSPLAMWTAAHRVFSDRDVATLLGGTAPDACRRLVSTLHDRLGDLDPVDLGCQLDVWAYMGSQLLRDSDVTSMASSLELRVPLVDTQVAATARAIPSAFKVDRRKVPAAKRVLVEATRDVLPADINSQPKRGFALPYLDWVGGPLRSTVDELLGSLWSRRLFDRQPTVLGRSQQWALATFELWCQALVDDAS